MKSSIPLHFLVCTVVMISFAACSKKDAPKPDNTTKPLTAQTWSIIKSGVDDNENGVIDPSEIKPIESGSYVYLAFHADGTATQTITGLNKDFTWKLKDQNEIEFYLDVDAFMHIKTLTANMLEAYVYSSDDKTLNSYIQCVPRTTK